MSYSYTSTESQSFTITHARHLAAKVATDLKRLQRLYGDPDDVRIARFEGEVTELLRHGYLGTVTYGYQRAGSWIEPTLRYTAQDFAGNGPDDDPGKIRPGLNIAGAVFRSYLTYSQAWDRATQVDRAIFDAQSPVSRTGAAEAGVNGYFADDRTYSSGGRSLGRASVRSY